MRTKWWTPSPQCRGDRHAMRANRRKDTVFYDEEVGTLPLDVRVRL